MHHFELQYIGTYYLITPHCIFYCIANEVNKTKGMCDV